MMTIMMCAAILSGHVVTIQSVVVVVVVVNFISNRVQQLHGNENRHN